MLHIMMGEDAVSAPVSVSKRRRYCSGVQGANINWIRRFDTGLGIERDRGKLATIMAPMVVMVCSRLPVARAARDRQGCARWADPPGYGHLKFQFE